MKIQVLGSGCASCKSLYELTKKAVEELKVQAEVEHVTDVSKIIELGIMSSPVLVLNGKIVMTGSTNNIEKIKELIMNNKEVNPKSENCCKCGCSCDCGSGCC